MSFFAELQRRNVLRAGVLYVGAVWALAQGISQLSPAVGLPDWSTRWFLIAATIGFPFWLAFAWFYEWTPQGLKRESEMAADASVVRSTGRRMDRAIIVVLAIAVVLLLANTFVWRKGAGLAGDGTSANILQKSIAVLPFENLSDDKKNEYFVAGIQDMILTKLADIGDLKVISRTSTAKYASRPDNLPTIAQQLGVATIMEGSVQKAGDQVLVNVQLIDARSDNHLWAQSYQRTLDNVFGVEGEVAGQIATALKAKLSPAQSAALAVVPTQNRAAYDLFLRAEYRASKGTINYDTASMKAAISLYQQAVEQDSSFALALAKLSYTESQLAWFFGGGEDVKQINQKARVDAEHALQLQSDLSAAQIALGYTEYWGRGDYAAALTAFAAALELKPNDAGALAARAYIERRQGRFDDAIASFQQALALDPRNSALAEDLGVTYMLASRYSDAENALQRALALDPDNHLAKTDYSKATLFSTGDIQRALATVQGDAPALKYQRATLLTYQRKYREALALIDGIPDTPDNFSRNTVYLNKPQLEASLYQLSGDMARAEPLYAEALSRLRAQSGIQQGINLGVVWAYVAAVQIGLGHTAAGLDAIARSQAIQGSIEDQVYGPMIMEINARGYAQARRSDLAVPLLTRALASPGVGAFYSPVLLWLDPAWDPIRDDPRFAALLKQYAKYKPAVIPVIPDSHAGVEHD